MADVPGDYHSWFGGFWLFCDACAEGEDICTLPTWKTPAMPCDKCGEMTGQSKGRWLYPSAWSPKEAV